MSKKEEEKYNKLLKDFRVSSDVYKYAAFMGHEKCLEYAYNHRYNDLEIRSEGCMKLFEKDKEIEENTDIFASYAGNINCLKFLINTGENKITSLTCSCAALGGNLECMKFSYENGASMDDFTGYMAAKGGNLDCIKYKYEKTGRLSNFVTYILSENGNLEALKYVKSVGGEWEYDRCLENSEDYPEMYDWILSKGTGIYIVKWYYRKFIDKIFFI